MTIPSLVFGFVIASLYGALFHLVRGGGPARLFLFMALSWLGFALGHIIGNWRGWILFPVGPLNFGAATIGSILLLALSLINFRRLIKKEDAV
jgi:hypothetical protein